MKFLVVLITLACFVAWLVGIAWLSVLAAERESWHWGIAAIALFIVPIALAVALSSDDDPYPNLLCMRGHQEWVLTHHAKGGTTRSKTWVCDQWEAK